LTAIDYTGPNNTKLGHFGLIPHLCHSPSVVSRIFQKMALRWIMCVSVLLATGAAATKERHESYQPVDVGFQFSTPVNLANTLQNSVAGPLSLVLVVAFTGILVAGLFVPKFTSAWSARSSDDDHNSRWHIFPVE
jgi:hypothetical protein